MAGNPNMVMAIAGNKADLEERRCVPAEVSVKTFLFVSQLPCFSHSTQEISLSVSVLLVKWLSFVII